MMNNQTSDKTPAIRATASSGTAKWRAGLGRRLLRDLSLWIPITLLVVWTVLPFLVTISISLKTRGEVYADPTLFPRSPTFQPYIDVWNQPTFRSALLNSVIVGLGTTLLSLAIGVPAAYAFARFKFRGRHLLLLFTLLPRLVPGIGLLVPLYRIAAALGVLDSRLTLIVVYTGMLLPLAVWLMVGFFQQIPRELEEAATVDGATLFGRLRYILLPLTVPALITIGVLSFREAWNEFQLALVLTSTPGKRTLPYELFLMQDATGLPNLPAEAAFAIITVLPFVLIYMRIERFVVQGITSGSVK